MSGHELLESNDHLRAKIAAGFKMAGVDWPIPDDGIRCAIRLVTQEMMARPQAPAMQVDGLVGDADIHWLRQQHSMANRDGDHEGQRKIERILTALRPSQGWQPIETFQDRVGAWMLDCFGPKVSMDRLERRDRLVEEVLELAQTLPEFTADRAHALVDYVFNRPVGVTEQEVGGVSVTLAALCFAEGISQSHWAGVELGRIERPEVRNKIRAKQASKPTGSAIPTPPEKL